MSNTQIASNLGRILKVAVELGAEPPIPQAEVKSILLESY